VLTADRTLMSEFRDLPNIDFVACGSATRLTEQFFRFLAPPVPSVNGLALKAPYGLRKVEAALLRSYRRDEVAVVDPDYLERHIGPETTIVGINVMEAFGLGPLTMLATYHGGAPSFCTTFFTRLVRHLAALRERRNLRFKIVVGGSAAWQFEFQPFRLEQLHIDAVIVGEVDHNADAVFQDIEADAIAGIRRLRGFPKTSELPPIVAPSVHDLVEVMRGCGRNCEFCEPNLRAARYYPHDFIAKEIEVNIRGGGKNAWLQTEDIFLYKLEDHRGFWPNQDAVLDLFRAAMAVPGVQHSNATHGTVAPAACAPELIAGITEITRGGPDSWIGIQTGIETGSADLIAKWMPLKVKPYAPAEWPRVVFEGTRVFNEYYWFPVYTLITGLPGETEEDVWDTVRLLDYMERKLPDRVGKERTHFWIGTFPFIPIGVMRGEKMFDFREGMTEARLALFYRVYRHMISELTNPAPGTLRGPWLNLGYRFLGPVGVWALKRWLDGFCHTYGVDPEKAMRPRDPITVLA
jgi:radical SAM superfamily enzyme YgiQ (UPF0313 family)